MAAGFASARSGLAALGAFGRRVREGEPYRSLADLLRYDEKLATLDLKVCVGADGRIRGFEILSIQENAGEPVRQLAVAPLAREGRALRPRLPLRRRRGDGAPHRRRLRGAPGRDRPLRPAPRGRGVLPRRARLPRSCRAPPGSPCRSRSWSPRASRARSSGSSTRSSSPTASSPSPATSRPIATTRRCSSPGPTRAARRASSSRSVSRSSSRSPGSSSRRGRRASRSRRGSSSRSSRRRRPIRPRGASGWSSFAFASSSSACRPGAMVILDELCSGTNPSEGEEIFELVVRMLTRLRPQAFITTHFLAFAARLEREKKITDLRFLQVELGAEQRPDVPVRPRRRAHVARGARGGAARGDGRSAPGAHRAERDADGSEARGAARLTPAMATFLTTRKMAPALAARIEASVRGARGERREVDGGPRASSRSFASGWSCSSPP